jgi:hypothetical protein
VVLKSLCTNLFIHTQQNNLKNMKNLANALAKSCHKMIPIFSILCVFICCLTNSSAYALGPSYEEDMARQRAQEQQIMEDNNTEEELEAARQEEESSQPTPEFSSAPNDLMQTRLKAAVDMAELAAASVGRADKLTKDPKFQQYQKGGWDFFQSKIRAAPGEYCSAFFWKKDGFVRLFGPGGGYKGAIMTFWGEDIPRPVKEEKVQVTLKQSGETPQTVEALNFITSGDDYDAIAFAVPSVEALLAGIEDVQSFDLVMGGKSVAKVDWHSGLMARKKLQDCVNAKTKK